MVQKIIISEINLIKNIQYDAEGLIKEINEMQDQEKEIIKLKD